MMVPRSMAASASARAILSFERITNRSSGALIFVASLVNVGIVLAVQDTLGDNSHRLAGIVVAAIEKGDALAAGVTPGPSGGSGDLAEEGERELLLFAGPDQEEAPGFQTWPDGE